MRNHQQVEEEKYQEIMVPVVDSLEKKPNLENPNLDETTHHVPPLPSSSSSLQDFKTTHDHHQEKDDNHGVKKKSTHEDDQGYFFNNINAYEKIKKPAAPVSCSSLAAGSGQGDARRSPPQEVVVVEESGRERLERHRVEMAGRVWIPDMWGQEDLLKDWIDCTVFDSSLGNNSIMSARAALVQEGRSRSTLRIENRC